MNRLPASLPARRSPVLRPRTARPVARAVPHPRLNARARLLLLISTLVTLALLLLAPALRAQAVPGQVEEWSGAGVAGWGGGTPSSNPGTGGRIGAGDGFLLLDSASPGNYGQNCTFCVKFTGNWTSNGVTQVRLWLNDVGADDTFEIHFALGSDANFWQYNPGFVPPENEWAEFVVDLTATSDWTRLKGSGTLASALTDVQKVLIRHDLAPFMQQPDQTLGDLGIDTVQLASGVVGIGPSPAASAIRLAAPYPNPARGAVTFALESPDAQPIRLQIIDVTGRSIRNAEVAGGASGPRTWMWDGRDDAGRLAAPGAYRVRASSSAGAISRPFTRIR